jgi:hypothetical protein
MRIRRRDRRALTLVELLVIIAIIGVLLAIMLPSVRTGRESARRNSCQNNVKQLCIAIQFHHDVRRHLPMASTAPLIPVDGIQHYGAVGMASPSAESPTNWTAGQSGDGYSWLAQCLSFTEEDPFFDITRTTVSQPRTLHDAAFTPKNSATAGPYFWSIKIPLFVCPSFPGEEDVAPFGSIPSTASSKVAVGNYVALTATHYRSTPTNHLESGPPTAAGVNAGGRDCLSDPYCGNGALPFPGIAGGKVQKTGLTFQDLAAGTSKVAIITESREENLTSWYSGLASYVVAAMPPPNGADPIGVESENGAFVWSCEGVMNCDTALNKGNTKGNTSEYYQPASPHGGGPRIWGPSSRHPSVVLHGFADAHTEAISDNIDKDVYLQLVHRNNGGP